jgi:hypothetical protein
MAAASPSVRRNPQQLVHEDGIVRLADPILKERLAFGDDTVAGCAITSARSFSGGARN